MHRAQSPMSSHTRVLWTLITFGRFCGFHFPEEELEVVKCLGCQKLAFFLLYLIPKFMFLPPRNSLPSVQWELPGTFSLQPALFYHHPSFLSLQSFPFPTSYCCPPAPSLSSGPCSLQVRVEGSLHPPAQAGGIVLLERPLETPMLKSGGTRQAWLPASSAEYSLGQLIT